MLASRRASHKKYCVRHVFHQLGGIERNTQSTASFCAAASFVLLFSCASRTVSMRHVQMRHLIEFMTRLFRAWLRWLLAHFGHVRVCTLPRSLASRLTSRKKSCVKTRAKNTSCCILLCIQLSVLPCPSGDEPCLATCANATLRNVSTFKSGPTQNVKNFIQIVKEQRRIAITRSDKNS